MGLTYELKKSSYDVVGNMNNTEEDFALANTSLSKEQ